MQKHNRNGIYFLGLAKDRKQGRLVAVKQMRKTQRASLEKEAHAIIGMINSRFTIRLYGCFWDQNYAYLVMEPALGGEYL